jgi:hypothetical protein
MFSLIRFSSDIPYTTQSRTASSTASRSVPLAALVVAGPGGMLRIDDFRLLLDEAELQPGRSSPQTRAAGIHSGQAAGSPSPAFLDLPLRGSNVSSPAGGVVGNAPGAFALEVRDADLSGENRSRTGPANIRERFPDWPGACIVFRGAFGPDEGASHHFRAYLGADVEVGRDRASPAEAGRESVSRPLTVRPDPEQWFVRAGRTG